MEERKFKTSAKCAGCVAAIAKKLDTVLTRDQWSIDLTSPNCTLTVCSDIDDRQITGLVKEAGFNIDKL